jgi:hypothetical protein
MRGKPVSPSYNRDAAAATATTQTEFGGGLDPDAMENAAEALRHAEVEAVQAQISASDRARLEDMSIDDLRRLAAKLDVSNRGAITQQDELIAAIRKRL